MKAVVCVALSTILATATRGALANALPTTFDYQVYGVFQTDPSTPSVLFDFAGAPIASGQVSTPGTFALGSIEPYKSADGVTETFHNLQFWLQIEFAPQGTDPSKGGIVFVDGELNGTITGRSESNVIASVTSVTATRNIPFPLDDLKILAPDVLRPDGPTTLYAYLNVPPENVPEPSTLIIGGILSIGAMVRHRLRRSRR